LDILLDAARRGARPRARALKYRTGVAAAMAVEQTFVMIKPDAVQRGLVGTIVSRFEQKGLKIKAMRLEMADRQVLERHYEVHKARPFYGSLIAYMSSGPVVPMLVEGESAIAVCRTLMGATNPVQGKPGEIRFDFAQGIGRNIIHGSDSAETARFEIGLWFPQGGASYPLAADPYLFE
jgi:nucleoside-diphosphate kinase